MQNTQNDGQCTLALATLSSDCMALTPSCHAPCVLIDQEARLQQLRADREAHAHRQIWTKLPHGGPYRKVGRACAVRHRCRPYQPSNMLRRLVAASSVFLHPALISASHRAHAPWQVDAGRGRDPLLTLPDGTLRTIEPGYEPRKKAGPTTNFVGNHMTQGAIDLVQAELEQTESGSNTRRLQGGGGGAMLLLQPVSVEPVARVVSNVQAISSYRWRDSGTEVVLEILLKELQQSDGTRADGTALSVACMFGPSSLQLNIRGGDGTSWHLRIAALFHMVLPTRCFCAAEELVTLPKPDQDGDAALPANCDVLAAASDGLCEAVLQLPPSCATLLVRLVKADASLEWTSLTSAAVGAASQHSGSGSRPGPNLVALRRQLRQQRLGGAAFSSQPVSCS